MIFDLLHFVPERGYGRWNSRGLFPRHERGFAQLSSKLNTFRLQKPCYGGILNSGRLEVLLQHLGHS